MVDAAQHSPATSSQAADGSPAMHQTESSKEDQPPLPSIPQGQASTSHEDIPRPPSDSVEVQKRVDGILQSDIGINTLLNRLKQSLASARDLSFFFKERSSLEERHSNGLKKVCRGTHELIRRPESRHGSFAQSYGELTTIQERLADNGLQFSMSLYQMSTELNEMAANVERGRKQWKHTGLSSEQRFQDAETAAAKAKTKYHMLAEQYDRVRTGDRQSGRFNLKTKSAAQQEEDLNRKVQAADAEYATKVQAAQASRQELLTTHRPQAVRAMRELISECDSAVALQLQKFASLSERLLLGNGLCVSPLKSQHSNNTVEARSQKDVVSTIDNDKDFQEYVLSFSNQSRPNASEIKYEKHPALNAPKPPSMPQPLQQSGTSPSSFQHDQPLQQRPAPTGPPGLYDRAPQQAPLAGPVAAPFPQPSHSRDGSLMDPRQGQPPTGSMASVYGTPPTHPSYGSQIPQIPPHSSIHMPGLSSEQAGTLGSREWRANSNGSGAGVAGYHSGAPHSRSASQSQHSFGGHQPQSDSTFMSGHHMVGNHRHHRSHEGANADLAPVRPVFGMSLEELFQRDGQAVPIIVQQCTAAVDRFGLDTEGIYRTSGSTPHMLELKALFDHDASKVNLLHVDTFQREISSVTTLLKHFLRSLPDPLLTSEHYTSFLTAAQISDEIVRRDSLHAIINDLPDPNYATLRHLTLHLHRVSQHASRNRMNPANLAVIFGPTLMGHGRSPPSRQGGFNGGGGLGGDDETGDALRDEASWQGKVVETIILSTFQIFDDDEADGQGNSGSGTAVES